MSEPSAAAVRATVERGSHETFRYVIAYDCGHHFYESFASSSGLEWCPLCVRYVGVIVMRKDASPDRERSA